MRDRFLGQEDPLEEGMATHSNILAWRIPWTEEPGGLQSMGSQESDMTEHAHTTQQTSLKDISSFCSTTYTFTVIWRPGGSWGCSVSWARRWQVGKTGPILHLSLPTFRPTQPYQVLTWRCGLTAMFHQHPLAKTCPWAWARVGVHMSDAVPFRDGGPRIQTLAGTITPMG